MAKLNLPTSIPGDRPKPRQTVMSCEWRCLECGKLLGIRRGARLHIRMAGHDYGVTLPVEANCRGCGAYNRT